MTGHAHWVTPFVGLPYALGAQGPAAFDCWSFFRFVELEHYGRDVPFLQSPKSWAGAAQAVATWGEQHHWRTTTEPRDGDAVALSCLKEATHIGVWISDLKAVLHCAKGSGSVLHDARHLAAALWRVRGFYTPEV